MKHAYYLLIGAVAGAVVLALEVLTARAMAPALGSGPATWSALLAVALGMLSVGNLLGGVLSERVSPGAVIAWSLAVASAYLVVLSQSYGPAMRFSAGTSLVLGSPAAAMITQAVPLGTLGTLTPAILRHGRGRPGHWAGLVLAAGSGGGIAGALLTGLVLLSTFGLARSYLLLGGILALAAVPAVWQGRRWLAGLALLASLVLAAVCWVRHEDRAVVQSWYGQLEVQTGEAGNVLLIDGLPQTGLPDTALLPGDGLRSGYLLEAALIMRPPPRSALVIGLGGGLAPRLLTAHGIECHTVEIDPAVLEIARDKFGFTGRATIADGRTFLAGAPDRWDLIFLDVCTSDRLAWHLFTREAMHTLRDRLASDGLLAIQFIGDDGPWSASLVHTVESVFDNSLMLEAAVQFGPVGPRWLFAARGYPPRLPDELPFPDLPPPWRIVRPAEGGSLLTDDHFPAEVHWARVAMQWRCLYGATE